MIWTQNKWHGTIYLWQRAPVDHIYTILVTLRHTRSDALFALPQQDQGDENMNEVFISGKITALTSSNEQCHSPFSFELTSTSYDNSNHINSIIITINPRDSLAEWAVKNLHINDQVLVKGSLIQASEKANPFGIEIFAANIVIV